MYKFSQVAVNTPILPACSILAIKPSTSGQIKRSFIADEYLAEEIHLNCNDERSLVAGSTSANKLARCATVCSYLPAAQRA